VFQLANHLSSLSHTGTAQPPVGLARRAVKTGDHIFPSQIQRQPLRAVDNILQDEVVNRGVRVFVCGANVKQIATGYSIRPIVENMQTIATPDHHQFTKLMSMFGKHILRIAIGDGDGLLFARKKV
jgi:hypothetical protein